MPAMSAVKELQQCRLLCTAPNSEIPDVGLCLRQDPETETDVLPERVAEFTGAIVPLE